VLPIPLHVPIDAVSTPARTAGPPLSIGAVRLTGGAPATVIVAGLAAATVASGFVAVTTTRSRAFSSATPIVYTVEVAPAMSVKPLPESRCQA
jgi:hypothetical protein